MARKTQRPHARFIDLGDEVEVRIIGTRMSPKATRAKTRYPKDADRASRVAAISEVLVHAELQLGLPEPTRG